MTEDLSLAIFPNNSPQKSEVKTQNWLVLHQNSLNYEAHQVYQIINDHDIRYLPKWKWGFMDQSGAFKKLPTRAFKIDKLAQKLHISYQFEGLDSLSGFLKKLTALKYISLSILEFNDPLTINPRFFLLIRALEKLSGLKSFKLAASNWTWATDKCLEYLTQILNLQRNSLKKFYLHFSGSRQFTDLGIFYLCKNLESLTRLQNISLRFPGCQSITDKGLAQISELLNSLANLQAVELSFLYCRNISVDGVHNIIKDFEKFKIIIFYLEIWRITVDKGLQKSGRSVLFSMHFHRHDIKAEFKSLRKILVNIATALQDHNLKLEHMTDSCESGFTQICYTIQTLPLLQNLDLMYSGRDDRNLKQMSSSLRSLKQLKHLSFRFMEYTVISRVGLQQFCKNLERLCSLENLNLTFSESLWMMDNKLKILARSLKKVVSLRSVDLKFSGCYMTSDLGFENLVGSLEDLVVLKEITLRIVPRRIKEERALEILKSHRSLSKVNLDFGQGLHRMEIMNNQELQKKKLKPGLLSRLGAGLGKLCLKNEKKNR